MPEKRKVSELEIHPFNERVYGPHDVGITSLAESLDDHGQQVPIKVTPDGLIVSGGRRWTAASRLDWDTVDVEVISFETDEEMKKYTLLANRYRGKKPPAMQAREADAWREYMEAGSEEEQEARREEVAQLARDSEELMTTSHRGPSTERQYQKTSHLASRAAGMNPKHYFRTTYVLDPQKGEADIQQSELPPPTKSALVRQIREDRAKLEADEISPTAAERRARSRLKEKVQEHTLDEEEIRQQEKQKAEEEMRRNVRRFCKDFTSLIDEYGNDVDPELAADFAHMVDLVIREIRALRIPVEGEQEEKNVYVVS